MAKDGIPTRMHDGTMQRLRYYDLDEAATMLPMSAEQIRRKLAAHRWPGAKFAGVWYMSEEDIADAVADARGEGTYQLQPDDGPPRLGTPLDDDTVDDLGGIR